MPGRDNKNIITRLRNEIDELKARLAETEDTLDAIRNGEVDAIIVSGNDGEKVFSLNTSETPYRTIIEEMDEGAVTITRKGMVLYSNHRFAEIISMPLGKVTGSDFFSFLTESDRPEFRRLLRKAVKSGIRGEVASVNGLHLQLSMVPLPDSMEGDVCIVVSDITPITNYQKYLQEMVDERTAKLRVANRQLYSDIAKLTITEKALRDSEERMRLLSETMLQGVIFRDAHGKIISVNPAAERILGISATESIGKDKIRLGQRAIHENGIPFSDSDLPYLVALRTSMPSHGVIMGVFNNAEQKLRWISIDSMPLLRKGEKHPYQVYSMFEDITGRKESEKEILKNEGFFRSAFEEGAIPMTITSTEGLFIRVNNAFCQLAGYTKQELEGMSFHHLTHPDDLEPSEKGRSEIMKGEKYSFRMEKRYIRKSGHPVWVNISSTPVRDENGNIDFFVTHIQDINKRKNAENRLRESKERFRQLANSIPQMAWIARPDGYIFWFNKRWYEYTGKEPDEVVGWGWQKVHDIKAFPQLIGQWKDYIQGGKPFELVTSILGNDGNFREFLTRGIPIQNNDGEVEQWFGTHTDISELKKIEKQLKESKEKLNIALENGEIGTWELNLKTNEMTWDERMEKMIGLSPGTFEGTFSAFESYVHEEDLPHLRKAIKETLESGLPFETIYRSKSRNGQSNFISAKALLNRDDQGKPLSLAGVAFDVTAMKEGAEKALIKLNEDLLRSNTDLQQFAYVASHDLQEPLRMVSSFTQLLQHKFHDKLGEEGNEFINFAVEGSKRMYELINGLLAYSRIQTRGKEFERVDMNEVLRKVKQNLSIAIEETGAFIRHDKLPVIFADENQMLQLTQNLIENSIKFRKGTPPQIRISHEQKEEDHLFSFSDKGIGIESQYFERIFRIFQRLHRVDEYEGTGIGLAICKRIVERHGGKIWVESAPGKGATFFFTIPIAASSSHIIIGE